PCTATSGAPRRGRHGSSVPGDRSRRGTDEGGRMSSETIDLLGRLPLFSRLGREALEAVSRRTVTRRVPENATLFRVGEPCQGLCGVLEGAIRVYRANREGREQVVHVQGPGQPIAEVPLFDGGPYPASARAVEESRVLFLSRAEFEWLYQNNPEI